MAGAEQPAGRWRSLFGDGAYAFQFGVRRGDAARWLATEGADLLLLAERRRWLEAFPERHCPWRPDAAPLLAELRTLLALSPSGAQPGGVAAETGGLWEPDFLLLSPDGAGEMIFRGGCVCFPTGWAPEEKLGRPVTAIHAPAPTLNDTLGRRIQGYLARVPAGVVGERENWGLAATAERNLHPALDRPRLTPPAALETTWLRIERQAFVPLPGTGGVAFLIRIETERLDRLAGDEPAAAAALAAALASMPAEIAAYKGLAAARAGLIRALEDRGPGCGR